MQRRLIQRIHWARLGLVGALALSAWALDGWSRADQERSACGNCAPSASTGLEHDRLIAYTLTVDPQTWGELQDAPRVVDWTVDWIPPGFGRVSLATLSLDAPTTVQLASSAYVVDYELSTPVTEEVLIPELDATEIRATLTPDGWLDLAVSCPSMHAKASFGEAMSYGAVGMGRMVWYPARQFGARIEPGQTALFPSPTPGEVIAVGVSTR